MEDLSYDAAGKINLNNIYNNPEPTTYFSTLSRLDYRIPQDAKPRFQRLIEARRNATETEPTKVVDLGCSYGVNGALLKHGFSMDELYRIYESSGADDPVDLLQQDRDRYADPVDAALEMLVSIRRTARYPMRSMRACSMAALRPTSRTGTDGTRCCGDRKRRPYHFDGMRRLCYRDFTGTAPGSEPRQPPLDGAFRAAHVRFRCCGRNAESAWLCHGKAGRPVSTATICFHRGTEHVLDNLYRLGIDASGAEETGWYLAELHVARPEEVAKSLPLSEILNDNSQRMAWAVASSEGRPA